MAPVDGLASIRMRFASLAFVILVAAIYVTSWAYGTKITPYQATMLRIVGALSAAGLVGSAGAIFGLNFERTFIKIVYVLLILTAAIVAYSTLPIIYNIEPHTEIKELPAREIEPQRNQPIENNPAVPSQDLIAQGEQPDRLSADQVFRILGREVVSATGEKMGRIV